MNTGTSYPAGGHRATLNVIVFSNPAAWLCDSYFTFEFIDPNTQPYGPYATDIWSSELLSKLTGGARFEKIISRVFLNDLKLRGPRRQSGIESQ